jgi:NADH-quinone oxidoreductase subunit M
MMEAGVDRLTALWLGPLVLAGFVLGLGRLRVPAKGLRALAIVGTGIVAALAAALFRDFDPMTTGFQFVRFVSNAQGLGVNYHVGVDGISLGLVVVMTFVVPLLLTAAWKTPSESTSRQLACILVIESALVGALVSLNLIPFLVFSEASTLGLAFLLGTTGDERRVEAATRFYLTSVVGSLLLWAVLLAVAALHFGQTGSSSFDLVTPPGGGHTALLQTALPLEGRWWMNQPVLFGAFLLGLALRAPLFPLHGWLRQVGGEASTSAVVLLAAGGMTLAAYSFLRFALPLFPVAALDLGYGCAAVAAVGVVYGVFVAFAQRDLRQTVLGLVSAHLMLVVLGVFVASVQSWNGSVIHLVTHVLTSSALLLLVGMLEERRGTRALEAFGGVARPMPVFAFFFGLVLLATTGLPLLAGFVGEMLILLGAFLAVPEVALLAASGTTGLAAVALVTLRRVLLGPIEREENLSLIDLGWREKWTLLLLVIPIVWIGVWPSPWLRRAEPAVIDWVEHVQQAKPEAALWIGVPTEVPE